MTVTIIINGTAVAAPEGAIAYKHNDPIEPARWIYDEDDAQAIAADDPSLIVRVNPGETFRGQLPTGESLYVDQPCADYIHRGIRVPADQVREHVTAVTMFDRDYAFTQHRVLSRDAEYVTLGPAVPYGDAQAIAAEDRSLIVRTGTAPATPHRLPLIGRDRTLVDGYAKKLRTTPLSRHGVRGRRGQSWETNRGVAWEVLLELDDRATGHICRVEVTLDRLEDSLVEL